MIKPTRKRNYTYKIGVFVTFLLEMIIMLIFLISIIGMLRTGALILLTPSDNCEFNSIVARFGVYSATSLLPILTIVITLVIEYNHVFQEIENDLARCRDLNIQIKQLPAGAGLDSFSGLEKAVENENPFLVKNGVGQPSGILLDYGCQILINFRQELTELYQITLCEAFFQESEKSKKKFVLRKPVPETIKSAPVAVRDNSGTKQLTEGEQISIFIRKDVHNKELEKYLYGPMDTTKKFCFALNFKKNDNSFGKWVPFFHFRYIVHKALKASLFRRQVFVRIEYKLQNKGKEDSSIQIETKNYRTYNNYIQDLHIMDVTLSIERRLEWVEYLRTK